MSETELKVIEPAKPSKLDRIKSTAITAAWVAIPTIVMGGSIFASYKMSKMQLDTAKINLETAKLNKS